ncbi:hypothetical protein EXS74_03135 [Candidatus Woesearchaeota archaeon]|nr:hypothetical protein [Candidatus Woesearchaeota archaeon]
MNKRGQLLGLPLLLVFALIVGAFIMLYGAKVIYDLTQEANYVDFLDTLDDLDTNIQTFEAYDVGSSKVYALEFPDAVEMLCFYDSTQTDSCTLDGEVCSAELEGELILLESSEYNIFVLPSGLYERTRFTITSFQSLEGNPVCVSNGGSITIQSQKDFVGVAYYDTP